MPLTYEPIATNTVSGSSTTSISFGSIPSTYTDLVVIINAGASTQTDLRLRFNSDTSTNYSITGLRGNGSAASSFRISNQGFADLNSFATVDTTIRTSTILNVMNYSNTSTFKTFLTRANNASGGVDAFVTLYRSTSAISNIQIYINGGPTIAAGSTFTLYGIKAA